MNSHIIAKVGKIKVLFKKLIFDFATKLYFIS